MVPTRRQLLGASAALISGLAGCGEEIPTPAPVVCAEPSPSRSVATDPPTVELRRPGSRDPIVTIRDPERGNRCEGEHRRAFERGFVTTAEAASWLRIDDVEGAEAARRFLDETDFETSFALVERTSVQQCFDQRLCYVEWSAHRLYRAYATVYRDYDVACSTDEHDRVARFVRLDGTVDPLQIENWGSHVQHGGCPVPPEQRDEHEDDGATAPEGLPATSDASTATSDAATPANDTQTATNDAAADVGPADATTRRRRWER